MDLDYKRLIEAFRAGKGKLNRKRQLVQWVQEDGRSEKLRATIVIDNGDRNDHLIFRATGKRPAIGKCGCGASVYLGTG